MQSGIHPNTHKVKYVCACGATFYNESTSKEDEVRLDICKECHPFFTGKQKLVDSSGRVEKFQRKIGKADEKKGK